MKNKKLFLALFVSVLFFFCFSCFYKASEGNVIETSAEDMWIEFVDNRDSAEKKFDGADIVLTGTISEVSESFMGKPCILLENGADSIPDGIFCFFDDVTVLSRVSIGDNISVEGVCSLGSEIWGNDSLFIFVECTLLVESPVVFT
jgi:hypothetical protein